MRASAALLASFVFAQLAPPLPGTPLGAAPLAAQHLVPDSLFRTRAPARPVLRVWEAGLVVGLTAGAVAIDQSVRNDAQEERTGFRNHLSDFGNAFGNKLYVYPALVAGTLGGLAVHSKGLTRVSWRALEATALAGASVEIVKTAVGRRRPNVSPEDAFTFRGFTLKDNSFPSGHTAIAFALATSLSRETGDRWSDAGFYTLATLTALSRVNDDRHWLSDTVFGAAFGIVSARLVERWHRPLIVGPGVVGVSATF
jgi:membrane-associated phospholipid phosphatase